MNTAIFVLISLAIGTTSRAMQQQKSVDISTFSGIWLFIKSSETGAEIFDHLKAEKYEAQRKDLLCRLSCFAIGACTVLESELNGAIGPVARELECIKKAENNADRLFDASLCSLPYTFLLFSLGYFPKYLLSLSRLPTSWPRVVNVVDNASFATMSFAGAILGFTGIMIVTSLQDRSAARTEQRRMARESALVDQQVGTVACIDLLKKLIEAKYPYTFEFNSEYRKISFGDTMNAETACKVLEKLCPVYRAFESKDANIGKSIATTLSMLRGCAIKNL